MRAGKTIRSAGTSPRTSHANPVGQMTPARWVFPLPEPRAVAQLRAALPLGSPAAQALVRRGYGDPECARRFLGATLEDCHDPLSMRDMGRAAERLECAVRRREKILIYGDYDVDGTTSVALLMKTIETGGRQRGVAHPHRLTRRLRHAPGSHREGRGRGRHADRQRGYRDPRRRSGAARLRAGHRSSLSPTITCPKPNCHPRSRC